MSKHRPKSGESPPVPLPPLRVRCHKNAPAWDRLYASFEDRLNEHAWFVHAYRNLSGAAVAAKLSQEAALELEIARIDDNNLEIYSFCDDLHCIFFWVSEETETVYILHAEKQRLFGGYSGAVLGIVKWRLGEVKRADKARGRTP